MTFNVPCGASDNAVTFDAFHLPTLEHGDYGGWIEWNGARAPRLTPPGVSAIIDRLQDAGAVLRARAVDDIVEMIDQAVARITEDTRLRSRAVELVAAFSGCSLPMADHIFEHMTADWRAAELRRMLDGEFPDRLMLDTFRPDRTGRLLHATGARVALHIFSGNVPGVAVTSMIRSLLVKCPVLGKTAAAEPVLPVIFAAALAEIDPAIGPALAVTYWPGGTVDLEAAALGRVDQVVHYGGGDAIEDMRLRVPAHVSLVTHGPRLSFGVVGRDALESPAAAASLAEDVAYATAVFDQQGCVSPHTVFVEEGGAVTPAELAGLVSQALARLSRDLPPAPLTPADAVAIREARAVAEFRAINGEKVSVLGPDRLDYTVIFDPVPELTASCLGRTLKLCPVHSLADVAALVAPCRDVLQSAAVAGAGSGIVPVAQGLAAAGVSRITSFRQLPWPEMGWVHDGRGPLRELVRWSEAPP